MRAKSPICGLDCLLEVAFKDRFINQPDLTDLETFKLAIPKQTSKILRAVVTAELSSSLNGNVVVHDNQGRNNWIHLKPSEIIASSFIAKLEPEFCTGCWICLERCQMQALTEDIDRVSLDTNRCIGCELCVSTCPSGALSLERKPESEHKQIPVTMDATWRTISQTQAKTQRAN